MLAILIHSCINAVPSVTGGIVSIWASRRFKPYQTWRYIKADVWSEPSPHISNNLLIFAKAVCSDLPSQFVKKNCILSFLSMCWQCLILSWWQTDDKASLAASHFRRSLSQIWLRNCKLKWYSFFHRRSD